MTPLRAIRAKCLECIGGGSREVRHCSAEDCPLFPFREGKNPNVKRKATPAQLEALKKGRLSKKSLDNNRGFKHDAVSEGSYSPPTENAGEGLL